MTLDYRKYYIPDIMHFDTSPFHFYKKDNKKVFIQPLLTGRQISQGKHWMLLFVDFWNENLWTIELYNSCPINHPEYVQTCEELKQNLEIIVKQLPTIKIYNLLTNHQKDDRSCGSFIIFYVYSRLLGFTPEQIQSENIPMDVIYDFRKMILAPIGNDDKLFWNDARYSIANEQTEVFKLFDSKIQIFTGN